MNKLLFLLSVCTLMVVTGCQAVMENDSPIANENHEVVNFRNRSEGLTIINPDKDNGDYQRFGFVRHSKQTALPRGGTKPHIALYDPELLADMISKLTLQIPNVHDVATLVTDRHVLVAYETNTEDRYKTADQVKKTAMSGIPRFLDVYVSDDPRMLNSIERFASQSAQSEGIHHVLEKTINEMLQSPQGEGISAKEGRNDMINDYRKRQIN